ncbi:MAG: amidase [Lautropia sp.]
MSSFDEICDLTAGELVAAISQRRLSPVEIMTAVLDRADRINPAINALCTIDYDGAMNGARAAERRIGDGTAGPLLGVPISIKDLTETAGLTTTYGSLIYRDNVPAEDALVVQRIRRAGAIPFAKSNTPEFGVGINTTNEVFGSTRNPWNPAKTAGGSSGGAGAAVASGLGPLAHGTDHGCSVRLPASFNGIVGLRPTPGLIPKLPSAWAYDPFAVTGPMARTAADCALLFDAMAGDDKRTPIGSDVMATSEQLGADLGSLRIGWSPDLGGTAALDPEIEHVCAAAVRRFASLSCNVDECTPDFGVIRDIIEPLRAVRQIALYGHLELAESPIANQLFLRYFDRAQQITAAEVGRAEALRSALWVRMSAIFDQFDLLATPTVGCPPFDVGVLFPPEIGGTAIADATAACMHCYALTMTGLPCLSIPAGFTRDGLPVGLQLVGPRRSEALLLRTAHHYEAAFGWPIRPSVNVRHIGAAGGPLEP